MSDLLKYTPHKGTLIIAGKTVPHKAAACAIRLLKDGTHTIDFFYIGAGAGQQAMKAMTIFSFEVGRDPVLKAVVTFQPIRVTTSIAPKDKEDPEADSLKRDASVWRTYILPHEFDHSKAPAA